MEPVSRFGDWVEHFALGLVLAVSRGGAAGKSGPESSRARPLLFGRGLRTRPVSLHDRLVLHKLG
jgi:hypothetical protein